MRELALHILDLARNSLEAGATRLQLSIVEDTGTDMLCFELTDNGRGMTREQLRQATDPFFTTRQTRHQGLGLPLLKATCERCGGVLSMQSLPGKQTRVTAKLPLAHLDCPPLGDMGAVIQALACEAERVHLTYRHVIGANQFALDTNQLQYELDDIVLRNPIVLDWLRSYVNDNLRKMRAEAYEARI